MKYVIIGSGVAGIAAIEAIRSLHPSPDLALSGGTLSLSKGTKVEAARGQGPSDVEITLIGDDPHGFYSRPGLAYYLTGELHDKALFPRTMDDFRALNFRHIKG